MKAIFYRFCNILWFISVATVICTFLSYFYQLNNANECADKQKIADKNYSIAYEKYEKDLLGEAKAFKAQNTPETTAIPQDLLDEAKAWKDKDESTKEPEAENLYCSSFESLTGNHSVVLLFPIFIFLFIYVTTGYIFKKPKLEANK